MNPYIFSMALLTVLIATSAIWWINITLKEGRKAVEENKNSWGYKVNYSFYQSMKTSSWCCYMKLVGVPRQPNAMNPQGWLVDPKGMWLLLFHKNPMSWQRWPKFYMDKWSLTPVGTPCTLKNRRKVELEPALETWNELIQNGWRKVNDQFGETTWQKKSLHFALLEPCTTIVVT